MLQTFHNKQLCQDFKKTPPELLLLDESNARNGSSSFKKVLLSLSRGVLLNPPTTDHLLTYPPTHRPNNHRSNQ